MKTFTFRQNDIGALPTDKPILVAFLVAPLPLTPERRRSRFLQPKEALMRGWIVAAAAALAACQSVNPDVELRQKLDSFEGQTVRQFIDRTGLMPADSYATATGRTFLVPGQTITMNLDAGYGAPVISRTDTCKIFLDTVQSGRAGTPDAWIITGLRASGPCLNSL